LPHFTGVKALEILQQSGLDIPFILVSGAVGEDAAVGALKAGAQDYVMKNNLLRLPMVVARELREVEIRRERKTEQEHRMFLAEAGTVLVGDLDYRSILEKIAALLVPQLADWCVIAFSRADQPVDVAFVAHADAKKVELARELNRLYPPQPYATGAMPSILRTEGAQLYPELPEDLLASHARDAEHLLMLRELGIVSAMVVPLPDRKGNAGAITLAFSHGERRYTRSDLALAEELGRRAALAIDKARLYSETQDAIRLRDEFLSVASHELKTPLTSLRLQLQMALRRFSQSATVKSGEPFRANLEIAVKQTERLAQLIENLLDVPRIVTGYLALDVGKVNLADTVHDVVKSFADTLGVAECTLVINTNPNVIGLWDRTRIEQIINNLLFNAIKFGAGKPIEITVEEDGEQALLAIRDYGIGIEPRDMVRIFDRFERAVSAQHYGGLGLGLYVARRLVEGHGGTISVASEPGRGSTFEVKLPLSPTDKSSGPRVLH